MPQLNYRGNLYPAFEGRRTDNTGRTIKAINQAPQAKQVNTLTFTGAGSEGDKKSIDIDGVKVEITVPAAPTLAKDRDLLVAAINAEPLVNGRVIAEAVGAGGVLTVTAKIGGIGFTVTNVDSDITNVATTANATAASVPFGRLILSGGQSASIDSVSGQKLGQLAQASALTAQVDTLTLTYDAGIVAIVTVEVEGETYSVQHTMATDAATSATAIAALLNGVLPTDSVLAAGVGDAVTLTAETAGRPFRSSTSFGPGVTTGAFAKATNAGTTTDIGLITLGISEYSDSVEKQDVTGPGDINYVGATYPPNYPINVRQGRTDVQLEDTGATLGSSVYVRLRAVGALTRVGGFRATPAEGCVLVRGARLHKVYGQDNLASIEYYEPGLSAL